MITDASIPFVQDGTRDGEQIRYWMQERFTSELKARGLPYVIVTGDRPTRVQQAKKAIKQHGYSTVPIKSAAPPGQTNH